MNKKRNLFFLGFLVVLLFILNYSWVDNLLINYFSEREGVVVLRIIDGDTIELEDGRKVRMLGINAPEKGESFYDEAKIFLEDKILNNTVYLEFGKEKTDLYGRTLAYVFYGKNINLELVENGLANFYFPSGKDNYYDLFLEAWEECLEKEINLCEKSEDICAGCVVLKEWDFKKDIIVFENVCSFDCDLNGWSVKDEGRKKFVFENFVLERGKDITLVAEDFDENYVWTRTGDSFFLRDEEGKLVLWENF